MAEAFLSTHTQRYAIVTGANKGIGFHICNQLAMKGITVVLTARDEQRGVEAQEKLENPNIIFHQLDVVDPASITRLVDFVKSKFGKLDILVNNAGISGVSVEGDVLILQEVILDIIASLSDSGEQKRAEPKAINGRVIESFKGAKECLEANFYGAKRVTEALIPLLRSSDSPRIVNVSSMFGNIKLLPNEWAKGVLGNEEKLTEERIEEVVQSFLKSFEQGSLEADQWSTQLSAYKVSKAALNAYTRLTAKKETSFSVNCVCPGLARTDITRNLGPLSAEEAAQRPVEIALLPHGGPSGVYFLRDGISPF